MISLIAGKRSSLTVKQVVCVGALRNLVSESVCVGRRITDESYVR